MSRPSAISPLSRRLIVGIFGVLAAFAALTIGLRIQAIFEAADTHLTETLDKIGQRQVTELTLALGHHDRIAIDRLMMSLIETDGVVRVTLHPLNGPTLKARRPGWQTRQARYVRTYELNPIHAPGWPAGTLTLHADVSALVDSPFRQSWMTLFAQLGLAIILAGVLILGLNRLVLRPLREIAQFAREFNPEHLTAPLLWSRNAATDPDELDMVAEALRDMQTTVAHHLRKEQRAHTETLYSKAQLQKAVTEKTHQLAYLTGFQLLVAEQSAQFLQLSLSDIDACIDDSLAKIGVFARLERCALFEYDAELAHMRHTHEWVADGWQSSLDAVADISQREYPWWLGEILNRPIILSSLDDLPASAQAERGLLASLSIQTLLAIPLKHQNETLGFVSYATLAHPRAWSQEEITLLKLATEMFTSMLMHQRRNLDLEATQRRLLESNKQLETLSRSDGLTGLANRRYFDEIRHKEFRRAIRDNLPLTLIVCDLDYFKHFNDTYGHAAGDNALMMFASVLNTVFQREIDIPARVGGEEFAVLLPNTTTAAAVVLAERVRAGLFSLNLPHSHSPISDRLTVSIGIASVDAQKHTSADALYIAADALLYQAKAQGRNQVVTG